MKRLIQSSKGQRTAVAGSLDTSARRLPTSGLPSVANARGASAAVAELSDTLGDALDQIDVDGSLDLQVRELVSRLDLEASKYDNSKVNLADSHQKWECSKSQARLVSAAWQCALAVYDASKCPDDTEQFEFRKDHAVLPSTSSSIKATTSTLVTDRLETNEYLPALVIAVRGSASAVDHMANANGNPQDAGYLLGLASNTACDLTAHAGFLTSAEALDKIVSGRIQRYIESTSGNRERLHVVFTGHSAGGAVASLLFHRALHLEQYRRDQRLKFSCIAFGAPPSVSKPLDLTSSGSVALCVNIINELDLVSRADRPYMLSLVDLVRSMYGLPPASGDSDVEAPTEAPSSPSPSSLAGTELEKTNAWALPKLFYHHIGARVILMMRLAGDELQLETVGLSPAQFEKLLFCRLTVHRRRSYAERVALLEQGKFNGYGSWQTRNAST